MARVKPEDLSYEIEEFVGSLKESDKHDWVKAVAKISWNGNPATNDIRNINPADNRIGKGISLSNEETDTLVDILLEKDYGSLEVLEEAVKRKKARFTIYKEEAEEALSCFDEDDKYVIEINL